MYNKNTFGVFMSDVINQTDKKSIKMDGESLSDIYAAPSTAVKMIGAVTKAGWHSYTELAKLLSSTSYFTFIAASSAFIGTPIGSLILSSLVFWGGKDSIKVLYNHREMVNDIKAIGEEFEKRYNNCTSESDYETMVNEASDELLAIAKQ
jgi:hypothetical protein